MKKREREKRGEGQDFPSPYVNGSLGGSGATSQNQVFATPPNQG